MPYVLSGLIHQELPGMWGEGAVYSRETIYDIRSGTGPPVNYSAHTLKPHSIPHVDAPLHIIPDGRAVDSYFSSSESLKPFYGPARVIKLEGDNWTDSDRPGIKIWRVTRREIEDQLKKQGATEIPQKLLLTVEKLPRDRNGGHDPNYVLVLEQAAAEWLVSRESFNVFGTSWKSSEYEPSSRERPIHRILLKQAILFEYLKLDHVPAGEYFFCGFPLPLSGASESPVCATLFTKQELTAEF